MNRLCIVILLGCLIYTASGQIGVKFVGTLSQYKIAETVSNEKLFTTRTGLGIDYWFRLRNYRLEILPALHFQYAAEKLTFDDQSTGSLKWSMIDFAPGFQIYPLDFKNDCMCPTFSKQGKFIQKGLFINLAPGIARSALQSNITQFTEAVDWIFFARLGLGMDIGLSDLITLSPSLSYQLSQTLDWSSFFQSQTSKALNLNSGLFLSARLGFRLDKGRY